VYIGWGLRMCGPPTKYGPSFLLLNKACNAHFVSQLGYTGPYDVYIMWNFTNLQIQNLYFLMQNNTQFCTASLSVGTRSVRYSLNEENKLWKQNYNSFLLWKDFMTVTSLPLGPLKCKIRFPFNRKSQESSINHTGWHLQNQIGGRHFSQSGEY